MLSPPTQSFVSGIKHLVGGGFVEKCHTNRMMPVVPGGKRGAVQSLRSCCSAK